MKNSLRFLPVAGLLMHGHLKGQINNGFTPRASASEVLRRDEDAGVARAVGVSNLSS